MRLTKKIVAIAGGGVLIAGVGAGVAFATIPDENGVINGCRNGATGALRVVEQSPEHCLSGETALDWNRAGPQGPTGPEGPAGAQGEQGPAGDPAQHSVQYYNRSSEGGLGPAGSGTEVGSKSVFCDPGDNAVGGGGDAADPQIADLSRAFLVTSVHEFGNNGVSGWRVVYRNTHPTASRGFFVNVRCAHVVE